VRIPAPILALMLATSPASARADTEFVEIPLDTPQGRYAAVALGDLDGDGRPELVSGRRDGEQGLVLFRREDGTWRRTEIRPDGEYGGVAIADVTGDRVPDVIAVRGSGEPRGLEIVATSVDGGKLGFSAVPSPYTEKSCDDLAVGDIEGDGDIDIAITTGGAGVRVLVNEGKARRFRVLTLETHTYEDTGIGFGDVNGDGRLDVIAGNHPRKNPWLFLCSRAGEVTYDAGHPEVLDAPGIGFEVVVRDFDRDGKADAAIGTSHGLRLFIGNGCSGPKTDWWSLVSVEDRSTPAVQVAVGDIDGDGELDIVFPSDAGLRVVSHRGKRRFASLELEGLPRQGELSGCALGDIDGDGDIDIAVSSLQGHGVRLFENRSGP